MSVFTCVCQSKPVRVRMGEIERGERGERRERERERRERGERERVFVGIFSWSLSAGFDYDPTQTVRGKRSLLFKGQSCLDVKLAHLYLASLASDGHLLKL